MHQNEYAFLYDLANEYCDKVTECNHDEWSTIRNQLQYLDGKPGFTRRNIVPFENYKKLQLFLISCSYRAAIAQDLKTEIQCLEAAIECGLTNNYVRHRLSNLYINEKSPRQDFFAVSLYVEFMDKNINPNLTYGCIKAKEIMENYIKEQKKDYQVILSQIKLRNVSINLD